MSARAAVERHAVLRTVVVSPDDRWVRCGPISIWPGRRLVRVKDRIVALSASQCSVLMALVEARGEPVSREALTAIVQTRPSLKRRSRVVDTHICLLRQKLGDDPRRPRIIVTVPAVGYAIET